MDCDGPWDGVSLASAPTSYSWINPQTAGGFNCEFSLTAVKWVQRSGRGFSRHKSVNQSGQHHLRFGGRGNCSEPAYWLEGNQARSDRAALSAIMP
jgi:hypothetical protein